MNACRVCMTQGHEAIKVPSGDYICPLGDATVRPPPAVARSSAMPGEVVLSSVEVRALRAVLLQFGDKALVLTVEEERSLGPLIARLQNVKPVERAGWCECARPTRGMSSFHCGNCGRVRR